MSDVELRIIAEGARWYGVWRATGDRRNYERYLHFERLYHRQLEARWAQEDSKPNEQPGGSDPTMSNPITVNINGEWAVVERPFLVCELGDCREEMFASCVECGGSFCLGHMAPDPDVEFCLCAACYTERQTNHECPTCGSDLKHVTCPNCGGVRVEHATGWACGECDDDGEVLMCVQPGCERRGVVVEVSA